MENKEIMVTIPLDDYDNLKRAEFMFDDIIDMFSEIIERASLSYYENDLSLDNEEINRVIKKYLKPEYIKKIKSLKEEKNNE